MPEGGFQLLSIDIEGHDLEVLKDLDMDRWRPRMVILEILHCTTIEQVYESDLSRYMRSLGYSLFSRLYFSAIFLDLAQVPGIDPSLIPER